MNYDRHQTLADIIAQQSVARVREFPHNIPEWYEGRVDAVALIHPSIATLSAQNEIRFLTGAYSRRHKGVL